jgi:hypothetical protein
MPLAWWRDVRAISDRLRVFDQWLRGQLFPLTVGVATFAGLILSARPSTRSSASSRSPSVIAGVLSTADHRTDHRGHSSGAPGPPAGLDVAVAAVIMYTVIQHLENNLLVPKIQGDAVGFTRAP